MAHPSSKHERGFCHCQCDPTSLTDPMPLNQLLHGKGGPLKSSPRHPDQLSCPPPQFLAVRAFSPLQKLLLSTGLFHHATCWEIWSLYCSLGHFLARMAYFGGDLPQISELDLPHPHFSLCGSQKRYWYPLFLIQDS